MKLFCSLFFFLVSLFLPKNGTICFYKKLSFIQREEVFFHKNWHKNILLQPADSQGLEYGIIPFTQDQETILIIKIIKLKTHTHTHIQKKKYLQIHRHVRILILCTFPIQNRTEIKDRRSNIIIIILLYSILIVGRNVKVFCFVLIHSQDFINFYSFNFNFTFFHCYYSLQQNLCLKLFFLFYVKDIK